MTAAQVGAEKPGELTEWAKALQIKQAEEQAKREAEMEAAGATTPLPSLAYCSAASAGPFCRTTDAV
jgi:hypothetical protein